MRSTNLVLFLVLINAAAGVTAVAAPADVTPTVGGGDEIESASSNVEDRQVDRRGSSELIGSFLALGGLIRTIDNIIFFAPNMFQNLGAPSLVTNGFKGIFLFVVTFDIAEAITGRLLS
jgi:hypothetical protein